MGSDGIGRGNGDSGLVHEGVQEVEGQHRGDVDIEVLPCHAEIGTTDESFPVKFVGGGEAHVGCLGLTETAADLELHFGWRALGWRFGVSDLASVAIGVDREGADVTGDLHTEEMGGECKGDGGFTPDMEGMGAQRSNRG